MIKIGDKVIFDSEVDPDDAHLNGSTVKVLTMECIEEGALFNDMMVLIEFNNGDIMDVDIHELREIDGENKDVTTCNC